MLALCGLLHTFTSLPTLEATVATFDPWLWIGSDAPVPYDLLKKKISNNTQCSISRYLGLHLVLQLLRMRKETAGAPDRLDVGEKVACVRARARARLCAFKISE